MSTALVSSALDELFALADRDDPLAVDDFDELEALQLRAAQERFHQHTEAIAVLRRRAADEGLSDLSSLEDLVPLMFSHTTYKSYPESFVNDGKWKLLTKWFETVSARRVDIDVEGIADVDDWIDRLVASGHHVLASGGTSGKGSFLDQSSEDIELIGRLQSRYLGWPTPIEADHSYAAFYFGPSSGPSRHVNQLEIARKYYAKDDAVFTLSDRPLRMAQLNRVMALQRSIANGTATPTEVAAFEASRSSSDEFEQAIDKAARALIDHHHEPLIVHSNWPQAWQVYERCVELGTSGGDFHPDSLIWLTGGTKGVTLPDDYREQLASFFAPASQFRTYGMTELSNGAPKCEAGVYHVVPWITLFVLDESGTQSLPISDAPVTGRAAFFDPAWSARWGGLVTGDQITARKGTCDCGRKGVLIEDSIARYADLRGGEDDKLTCAAAIEAYIRGAVA